MDEGFLTQQQYEQIGKLVDLLVAANVFSSVGDERIFLKQHAGVKSRHGLTERQAELIIEQMHVRWPGVLGPLEKKQEAL